MFWEEIEAAAYQVVEHIGPEMQGFLQELISVPVQVSPATGRPPLAPRRGLTGQSRAHYWRHIPRGVAPRVPEPLGRSKPGEPPRLETGRLYHSIGQHVFSAPGQGLFSTIITSEAPYRWVLQIDYNRPYISTTFDQFVTTLPERLLESIRARFH